MIEQLLEVRRRAMRLALGALALLPAACAVPTAGPNAGATPVAAGSAAPPAASPAQPASKPTLGQEIGAVADNQVAVLFPAGSAVLTPEADQKLDLAARLFRDVGPAAMFVAGYTDHGGDEYQNLLLSARRAETVKRALVARGLPPSRLLIRAFGESDLANTSDPLAAENRRVLVTWRVL